jgi:crotonobetainyl-CoA:carnitine CoA-transferase CaiB-like acyl-CoA transferase
MFRDLRVLELASVLAGPSVGQFFAELGADVIKIENLKTRGDVTRTWKTLGEMTDDRSAYFCSVNWGKRSVAIDLETPEGLEVVQRLAEKADVIIASYKPGDAEKLKVDYKTLSSRNKGMIYGQVTGYGSDNKRVGYDAIIQAEAGFMFMNGEPGGSSLKMPVALMDVLAGHHLKEGILLGLLKRATSGIGGFVEVSLIGAAISSLVNQATNWLVGGVLPEKQGSAHPNIAPYGDTFVTADDKEILLAVGNDRQFQDLCALLDLGHLSGDANFINNRARVVNRVALNSYLQEKIGTIPADDFIQQCQKRNIPSGIIQNMKDVFSMKESAHLILEGDGVKGIRTFATEGYRPENLVLLPPPHFGEHTVAILQELGMDGR